MKFPKKRFKERRPLWKLIKKKVLDYAEMDMLTMELKDREEAKYYKIWDTWDNWLGNRCKSPYIKITQESC